MPKNSANGATSGNIERKIREVMQTYTNFCGDRGFLTELWKKRGECDN